MKCQFKRSISIIFVLLLIVSVVGLTACGQDATPAAPNTNASPNINVESTPQYTPTESKDTTSNIIGEYHRQSENGYMVTIFHDDMTFVGIRVSNSDSILEFFEGGVYTVSDNLVTITWDAGVVEELTYDPVQRTLTEVAYSGVYSFFSSNIDGALSIAGTWKPLSNYDGFPLAFGDLWYKNIYAITFYRDGSYELNDNGEYGSHNTGTYQIIQDGSAIKIDDTDYRDPGIMKYELISDNILLIESRPDSYPGRYYVLVRTK